MGWPHGGEWVELCDAADHAGVDVISRKTRAALASEVDRGWRARFRCVLVLLLAKTARYPLRVQSLGQGRRGGLIEAA